MYSIVSTAIVCGIRSVLVQVEADVCDGMPAFEMVGILSSEVREAKERIRAAIRNSSIRLSPKKITINLYPADIRKSGTVFDLPIALAILAAYGRIPQEYLEGMERSARQQESCLWFWQRGRQGSVWSAFPGKMSVKRRL